MDRCFLHCDLFFFFALILSLCFQQSSKSAADRKAVSRLGGALDGEMSSQGGIGELSELPRGCGSGGGGGGAQGEMELGPTQGECLMGAAEVDEPLSAHLSRKTAIMSQFESKALGLDKAILHSIDCCGKWSPVRNIIHNTCEIYMYIYHILHTREYLIDGTEIENHNQCYFKLSHCCFNCYYRIR